jgi:hypothetical protein
MVDLALLELYLLHPVSNLASLILGDSQIAFCGLNLGSKGLAVCALLQFLKLELPYPLLVLLTLSLCVLSILDDTNLLNLNLSELLLEELLALSSSSSSFESLVSLFLEEKQLFFSC